MMSILRFVAKHNAMGCLNSISSNLNVHICTVFVSIDLDLVKWD